MQQDTKIRRTVLLVEDDDDTRRVYSVMLRHAGLEVVEAATGPDAVKLAIENAPDLILMDMNLPMLDGWEAARQIREDPRVGTTPLLAFSALIDSTADLRREALLFDGFIAKPVSPAELVRRVTAYVALLVQPTKRTEPSRPNRARREPSDRVAPVGRALQ